MKVKVFLDGRLIGETTKPKSFVNELREQRRKDIISSEINLAYLEDINEIRINTDENRLRRPLIIVKNKKPLLTEQHLEKILKGELGLENLVKKGVIEYLDAEEEENLYIALNIKELNEKHTHLELNPSVILGIAASMVPFVPYNRSDRINYGAKMMSQSLGNYAVNYLLRPDTKAYSLIYPQHPIIDTVIYKSNILNEHPQGQNVIIAIMPYKGYNMEDAIILNKSSVERGLFRSLFFRTYQTSEKKYWGIESDEICVPDESTKNYRGKVEYENLDEEGIAPPETEALGGKVVIGKVSPLRFYGPIESFLSETENRRDTSITVKFGEKGIVDRVILTQTESGDKLIKSTVRETRIPEIGDKFASRYGQKGVVGAIVPEEDLPFTGNGIVPDVILNPLGIPSRMTIGQLMELMYGKVAALSGEIIDGSAFNVSITETEIGDFLEKSGFNRAGIEEMYNGETGEKLKAKILIGPCYYQRLYHMVTDKYFMRARGPTTILTRQPTEGKAREGGLRFGEMEKDCLLAHGAALTLKERFSSDETEIPVCKYCGIVAVDNRIKGISYCPLCKKSDIIRIKISYAFKLVLDEMMAMGVYPKLHVKEEI